MWCYFRRGYPTDEPGCLLKCLLKVSWQQWLTKKAETVQAFTFSPKQVVLHGTGILFSSMQVVLGVIDVYKSVSLTCSGVCLCSNKDHFIKWIGGDHKDAPNILSKNHTW